MGKHHRVIGYRPPVPNGQSVRALRDAVDRENEEARIAAIQEERKKSLIRQSTPITAIRGWHLVSDSEGWRLSSLTSHMHNWEGPANRTSVIDIYGDSGFYAVGPHQIHYLFQVYGPAVLGLVELSGTVVESELVWRASKCLILELFLFPKDYLAPYLSDPKMATDLARRYDCDVSVYNSYDQFIYEREHSCARGKSSGSTR